MKKIIKVVLSALVLCSVISVNVYAEDNHENIELSKLTYGLYEYTLDNSEITITGYDTTDNSNLEIPNQIDGYNVTAIGASAFGGCSISGVTIPDSVKTIGDGAFNSCKQLRSVTIPEGVTSMGVTAFTYCDGLTSVTIPGSLTSIPNYAFFGCTGLKSVTITDGVTSIGEQAFKYCSYLESITIPSSVETIGLSAFLECTSLQNVTMKYGVTSIEGSAFYRCSKLTNITIPKSVTNIGGSAFSECSKLESVTIPSSVITLGRAFNNCKNLKYIFYAGTKGEWSAMINSDTYSDLLANNTVVHYKATGHEYNTEWTIDKNATCVTVGSKSHHCLQCDEKTDVTVIGKTEHTWDAGRVMVAETCTEKGMKEYTCQVCEETKVEDVDALGHDYEDKVTEPTCTTGGFTTHTCKRGDHTYTDSETKPNGHSFSEWKTVVDVGCETAGTKTRICKICNYEESETIDPTGHSWNNGEVSKDATCTEKGVKTYTCSGCKGTKTEEIKELGHDCEDVVTEPTCTTGGFTTHTCKRGDHTYTDSETEPIGHTFGEWKTVVEPKCETAGTKTRICKVCDHEESATIDPTGHSWNSGEITKAAKCTEKGEKKYICLECEAAKTESIAALDHNYSTVWTVDVDPSCTKEGEHSHHCTRCDARTDVAPVEKLGHTEVNDPAEKPTCTTEGKTEGKHCSVCNEVLVEQKTIAALDHDYKSVVTVPTCTAGGYTTHTCSRCNDSYTDSETEPKGHTEVTIPGVSATCLKVGQTAGKKCSVCGTVTVPQKIIAKTAHTFNIYGRCSKCGTYAAGISTAVPSMKVKSISKAKGALTVKWAKNTKVKGYQIRYSLKPTMTSSKTVNISKNKTTSKKISKLLKKTKYYVQIRAYALVGGKTMYSPWSAVKSQTTK